MLGWDQTQFPCFTGIGSRETPDNILDMMTRIGKALCDRGYRLRSGGARGADTAFYQGVRQSHRFREVGCEIFLPFDRFRVDNYTTLVEDPEEGIWNFGNFDPATWEHAKAIALKARGGDGGLNRGGIALHTRNAAQVLGGGLNHPSRHVICWAKPFPNGRISGGTNTAVQIAITRHIPVINLYTEAGWARANEFLKRSLKEAA